MGIDVTVTDVPVTVSASGTQVNATVGGGQGPQGPTGPSGVITVSPPLVNAGTSSAAELSLSVGAGLDLEDGSLVLSKAGAEAGYVLAYVDGEWMATDPADVAIVGPVGPQGPAGATGPKGDKGDQGDTGSAGAKGDKGDTGDAGAAGAKGDKGDTGDTGATGATGPQGPSGVAYATAPVTYDAGTQTVALSIGTGLTTSSGSLVVSYGTSSTTACVGNDSRLSDARTPTSHTHGNITYAGAIGATSGLPVVTTTSGVLTTGAFGTSSGQFAAGDHTHSQLHDRSHAITSTSDHTAGNWKVFYSNGSGQVLEVALGDSSKFLRSNGASSAPTWETAGSSSASDLTSGTLAYARMADPTVTSPSQITASQNDYASFARGINRFTTNAAYNLTGMVAGNDGEVRVLSNTGSTAANTLTIKDENTSSTAANRFTVPWSGDCVIPALGSVVVFYDGTSSRWRVL